MDTTAPEAEQVERIASQGRIRECNEPFARLYGRSAGDLVGLAFPDFVPAEDPRRSAGVRLFVRSGYRLVDGEEMHTLEDGSSRWVRGSALGVVERGRLRAYWLTLADVTAAKRAEQDRERRGRILEAVAFGAARLLAPGPWKDHANDVLSRLGGAAEAGRAYLAETSEDTDGGTRFMFQFAWATPGLETRLEELQVTGGFSLALSGLTRLETELRAGRPVVTLVSALSESERVFPTRMGSRSFAIVPIFADGRWWGFLGFGETRFEREWSVPEVEALKAAAAVFGAAVEREHADVRLHEVEERFERLAAAAFEGIAVTEGGTFVDANEQLAGMLGCTVADLVGRPVEEFVAAEDRETVKANVRAGVEGPYQHRAMRLDGSALPVEVRARPLPYRGRTVRVSAVRDVSERLEAEERQRRLEAELRQAADEWRQTFDALDLGIVLASGDGRILRLNRSALDLGAGPGFAEAVGRRLDELPDREPWRTLPQLHRSVALSRASRVAEAREAATGRSFYLLASPWSRNDGE
ncbi:MAG TPA: PAS domain S-box protein, partial [Vicinamibacteria bacterium]|nr:PAS domain S-box protein [Vicinamibacteria bacterium]